MKYYHEENVNGNSSEHSGCEYLPIVICLNTVVSKYTCDNTVYFFILCGHSFRLQFNNHN